MCAHVRASTDIIFPLLFQLVTITVLPLSIRLTPNLIEFLKRQYEKNSNKHMHIFCLNKKILLSDYHFWKWRNAKVNLSDSWCTWSFLQFDKWFFKYITILRITSGYRIWFQIHLGKSTISLIKWSHWIAATRLKCISSICIVSEFAFHQVLLENVD